MSHFAKISVQFKNKDTLANALDKMGLKLTQDFMCRYYYGRKQMPYGARLPSAEYDLGFEVAKDGSLEPVADFWGGSVAAVIGSDGSILKVNYSVAAVEEFASQNSYGVNHVSENKLQLYDPSDSSGAYLEITISRDGNVKTEAVGFSGQSCDKFEGLEKALGKMEQKEYTHAYYEQVPEDQVLIQEDGE